MKKIATYAGVAVLLVISIATHFAFFGYPAETVFDEVHFGKFISGYLTGEYFFDIHPPLAKLLISAVGYFGEFDPVVGFGSIGESLAGTNFAWLRLLPAIAGTLLPIIIYMLSRTLKLSRIAAFTAGLLVILENSLLVQSRFILLDSILLLLGFSGLAFYFSYRNRKEHTTSWARLTAAIALGAFAVSIKWTGLSFLAIMAGVEIYDLFKKHALPLGASLWKRSFSAKDIPWRKPQIREFAMKIGLFVILPFAIYFAVFAVHFALLDKTGPGKDFMSKEFQKTLAGNKYEDDEDVRPSGIFDKFIELNAEMYRANQRLDDLHAYGSPWYSWVYMKRPVYFWDGSPSLENTDNAGRLARIYLLGNPLIYWIGSASVIILLGYFALLMFDGKASRRKKELSMILLAGYFINLIPFIFIGRVMFIYHYFAALIFSIIILAFLIDEIAKKRNRRVAAASIIAICALSFIYFAPLSYGLPMETEKLMSRFWFKTWQ